MLIAKTPEPPYYAIIFSSIRTDVENGYSEMADRMAELATEQDGFLGLETAREEIGITVSYWKDLESVKKWQASTEHLAAQEKGRSYWYKFFKIRIAKIERECEFEKD